MSMRFVSKIVSALGFAIAVWGLSPAAVFAQDSQNLAKQLSNPIANLTSVPIQFNYDRGIGPDDKGYRVTANVQPVVPLKLNENWTLISRTILPVIYQDNISPVPGTGDQFGLGDVVQSFFFSPSPVPLGANSQFIYGAGPVLLLPTGTEKLLTTDKWGAGPTAVGLVQSGPWTIGTLANHIWSYAGDADRQDVNATFLQPFISYTTPDAYTFTINTEATYDWKSDEWSVPVNVIASKLTRIGGQAVSFGIGARYYVESTPGGPEGWGARFTTTFLFPN
jgi:hypothetical protein